MSNQPKSDRTSVTISKRVHQDLKIAAARLDVTQRSLLERMILDWLRWRSGWDEYKKREEE